MVQAPLYFGRASIMRPPGGLSGNSAAGGTLSSRFALVQDWLNPAQLSGVGVPSSDSP